MHEHTFVFTVTISEFQGKAVGFYNLHRGYVEYVVVIEM